jgi:hypothetical protein
VNLQPLQLQPDEDGRARSTCTFDLRFSLWQRVRILFGVPLCVKILTETKTTHDGTALNTATKVISQILPRGVEPNTLIDLQRSTTALQAKKLRP